MDNIETIEELFQLTQERLVGQAGAISITFAIERIFILEMMLLVTAYKNGFLVGSHSLV